MVGGIILGFLDRSYSSLRWDGLHLVRALSTSLQLLIILMCFLDRDQKFALLAIAVRLDSCLVHDRKCAANTMDFAEDSVHFLKRPVRCFGEEKVNAWNDEGVDDGENGISMVLDTLESHGSNHHNLYIRVSA
jgi:hypothetical protein